MSANGFVAVGMGAGLGAWLRWWLGILFNPVYPTLPLGTLSANLLGGFLMGLAMELLAQHTALPPEIRLGITTGFIGGVTTFSTFEVCHERNLSQVLCARIQKTPWDFAL